MKIDTSKANLRSIRPDHIGPAVCECLNLRFPTIYRIVESVTREVLDRFGLRDKEPYTVNHYSLSTDDKRYVGTIERTAISTLDANIDNVSLVIRHHQSCAEAEAYPRALYDFGANYEDEFCENKEGIFTLITRPTRPSWPGPLIIYCVDSVSADTFSGDICGDVAVAPHGTFIEPFDDFF